MLVPRKILLSLLFVASTALFLFGFFSNQLLQQDIWDITGKEKFIGFVVLFSLWAGIGWKLFPANVLKITVVGGLFYVIAATGFVPLPAVAYFLLSSWCLGRLLQTDSWLALPTGICSYAWIIGFLALFPVNYTAAYIALFAIPLYLCRKELTAHFATIRKVFRSTPPSGIASLSAAMLLAACLMLHLLVAMKPELSHDGLSMHLAIPASIAFHHQYLFSPKDTVWAVMPMMGDWSFTSVYLLGGEMASRLLNFSFLLILVGLVHQSLRRYFPQAPAVLLSALFASSPIVQLLTGSLFVENFWAINLFTAFLLAYSYWESGHTKDALLSAMLLGIGIATKFGSMGFAIPLFIFLCLGLSRWKQKRWSLALFTAVLAFGSPHYIRAYIETGNPIFPFLNNIFKSPYFDATEAFVDIRFLEKVSATTLYDLTFHTEKFLESLDGGWAFQYVFFVPVAFIVLAWRRSPLTISALVITVIFFHASLISMANARYIFPAFALLTLLIGNLFEELKSNFTRIYRFAIAASLILLGLNLWFLPASGWYHRDLAPVFFFQPQKREAYRNMRSPERELVDFLNTTDSKQAAAFIGTNVIAGFQGKAYTTSWHHPRFVDSLQNLQSQRECFRLFDELQIEHLIVPKDLQTLPHAPQYPFEVRFSEPEKVAGNWKVVRLIRPKEFLPPQAINPLDRAMKSGNYDDSDQRLIYKGKWINAIQFPRTTNSSMTYSNDPQASVMTTFSGTSVTLIFTRAHNRGFARVLIDGQGKKLIDGHSLETRWQASETISGLSAGEHTVELRLTGKKNPRATDSYFDLDGIIIGQE